MAHFPQSAKDTVVTLPTEDKIMPFRIALVTAIATGWFLTLPALASSTPSIVSGEGSDLASAVSSALRHAVEHEVSMSIGQARYVGNIRKLEDEVFSKTKKYIESYKIVDEVRLPGGGYRITVAATVARDHLNDAVSPIAGSGTIKFDGITSLSEIEEGLNDQIRIEKNLKSLLDELAGPGLVISCNTRTSVTAETPNKVTVYFDNLSVVFSPDWYERYRKFHQEVIKTRFGSAAMSHARSYSDIDRLERNFDRFGLTYPAYLVADFLNSKGELIVSRQTSALSVYSFWTNRGDGTLAPLLSSGDTAPVVPPVHSAITRYGSEVVPSAEIDKAILPHVKAIRLRNPEFSKYGSWPVSLE